MKKMNSIFREVLKNIKPTKEESKEIRNLIEDFLKKLKNKIAGLKIDVEPFIGGSFSRNTLIKKTKYDIDIFLRFSSSYKNEEISKLTENLIRKGWQFTTIHGSRDYFRIKLRENFYIELVPVKKIKNVKEAENTTDLSYFHVKYINKKIKSEKILDEIRIAKAFCHANNCYGAESYINGFSGYSLELLILYYKSFLKFIKEMSKIGKEKAVIDIERFHKNKKSVLMDLNSSKLQSPIILIDPTFKQRNALAALSYETFEKFKKCAKEFLKNPSIKSFEAKKPDLEKIKDNAQKNKQEFIIVEVSTNKQVGDVAGSKLFKFYKHLNHEIKRYFGIKSQGFNYNDNNSAKYFFVVKSKKEIMLHGPGIKDKKNVLNFRKRHKITFVKNNKIYAKEKVNFNLKEFFESWVSKNKKRLGEMYVTNLEVIDP